eukprot:4835188-Alexandrium_andersonii.AAC.1
MDALLFSDEQVAMLLGDVAPHLRRALDAATRSGAHFPRTPLMDQVAWLAGEGEPQGHRRWVVRTARDSMVYRAEYAVWFARQRREASPPQARADQALSLLAWMVPRSVFKQQAAPLLAAAGVDVDPFRAWTVALERRGCGRPDQLSTLSAQGPDPGAPLLEYHSPTAPQLEWAAGPLLPSLRGALVSSA